MENKAVIINRTEFFKASYHTAAVKVAPRNFSSLTFRLSGKVSIFTTDTSFVSKPNSLTFVPAGCAYETTVWEDGEMFIMHYTLAEGARDFCDHPMTVTPQHTDAFLNLFTRAVRHFGGDGSGYDSMADAYRLLAEAERVFFSSAPPPYRRLIEIKQYVDENLCNNNLKVSMLAERFGTSEVYFRREFKKYYGHTPIEYIKRQRLEIACQLLRTHLYSVAEVATRAGFDSISYFSAEFHRNFGCSPREYQTL